MDRKGRRADDKRRAHFDSDFILYRYAEAFLMDAEIKYYRKDYGGALTALGEITKRAYGNAAHYTDQSEAAVKRAIVEESLKELVGEGRTWWTLIRLDAVWEYNKDVADKREATPTFSCGPSRRSPSSRIPSSNRRRAGIDT
ncbi:MAG: RagB/SusD family nutrient uptake outer membrane protein [Alistipes sp.]